MSAGLDTRLKRTATSTRVVIARSQNDTRRRLPNKAESTLSIVIFTHPTCLRHGSRYVQRSTFDSSTNTVHSSLLVRTWEYLVKDERRLLSNLVNVRHPDPVSLFQAHSRLVPDLIFSEMNFLSRRARLDREELPREDQQDRINKTSRRENDLQTQILQYFSNDYPEEAPIVEETAYPIERRDTSCQPESYAMATSNANVNRAMESAVLSPETKCKSPSKSVTPYTWSESECRHDERLTSPEICTKGILCADMDHQHISNEEKADKRYWDLDELKLLLKIREQRRNESRANKEPGTCDHSKRERQPDEAEDVSGSPSKNAKNDITSVREGFSSPPSSRTERSYSPSHGHPEPGTYTPGRQANSNLERHELKVTPNRLWFSGSRPTSQSCSPVIALHENPSSKWNDDAGPSNEIDLDAEFDNVIARICSRETAYDKDDDVIMKDFDAVYNSIVNSGDGDLTYANFFRVSSNQDYVFSRAGCPTHPLLGDIDEVCNSSLLSRATGHNPLPKSTFQNEGVQVTNNALYDAWNKFSQPIASAVGMGAAPFGVSTGFCWRQNKLY